MTLQDFQTSKCSHLVNIPFALSWSEDNMVAMATEKGVYLWEIVHSPHSKTCSINVRRHFLLPTSEMKDVEIDYNSSNIGQNMIFQWMQDISFFTSMNPNSPPSVTQLSWSPCFDKFSEKSYLSLLLDCGSLNIYKLKLKSWIKIGGISKLWLKHCAKSWKVKSEDNQSKNPVSELAERAHKIKITAFVWGKILCKENIYSCLFTGNMSGDIAVWNIRPNNEGSDAEIELLSAIETQFGHITSLWFQSTSPSSGVLIISDSNGRIHCIPVSTNDDDGMVTTGSSFPIWNYKDKISIVPNGGISLIYNNNVTFIAAKGRHILVFQLDTIASDLKNVFIKESGDIAVTGFTKFSANQIMCSTKSGDILMLIIGDTSFEPELIKIRPSLRSENYACYGIALSNTKVIAAIAYSVTKNYDHLAVREPSHIAWCSLPGLSDSSVIIKNYSTSICDIWDALDIYRIECIQKAEQDYIVPSLQNLDTMDIKELKKNLWLTHISCLVNNGENLDKNTAIKDQIIILVFSCNIYKRISTLFSSNTELSDFNKRSLFLMKKWLEYILDILDTTSFELTRGTALTLLKQMDGLDLGIENEHCSICSSEIPGLTGPNTSECPKGHTIPRCSLSLVQCDVLPYYYCPNCQAIAHPEAVLDDCICIYCDAILEKDENILIAES